MADDRFGGGAGDAKLEPERLRVEQLGQRGAHDEYLRKIFLDKLEFIKRGPSEIAEEVVAAP